MHNGRRPRPIERAVLARRPQDRLLLGGASTPSLVIRSHGRPMDIIPAPHCGLPADCPGARLVPVFGGRHLGGVAVSDVVLQYGESSAHVLVAVRCQAPNPTPDT